MNIFSLRLSDLSKMIFALIFGVFSFFALVVWYTVFEHRPKKGKKLPGPVSFPFLGSAVQIAMHPLKRNYEIFEALCKTYGPIYGLKAGVNDFVIIKDFDTAKKVLSSKTWDGRLPNMKFIYERSFNKNLGLIFSHGESWKEIRRYTLRTLRQHGFGKGSCMSSALEVEVNHFLNDFDYLRRKNDNCVGVHHLFHVPTLNITWAMISGIRFSTNDSKLRKFLQVMDDMVKANRPGLSTMSAYPFLRYIPGLTEQDATVRVHKELQQMFKDILDEKRAKGTYKDDPNDFLEEFLRDVDFPSKKNETLQTILTEEQLLMVCIDLFFTSSDTTSAALEFALLYMLKNSEVKRKVQQEIDSVIGRDRLPNLDDRIKMPYLEATLLEVLRYASINPMAGRSSREDTLINGYFVPKNATIGILLHGIHFDENTWGDPRAFRPERFLNENMDIINKEKIMPFGHGTRNCIGETLARASFFIFFVSIMQRYNIEKSTQHPQELTVEPRTGMTSTPEPFFLHASTR